MPVIPDQLRQELLTEARQLVIGLIHARVRADRTDTRFLLRGWVEQCAGKGVNETAAWSLLATAAVVWAAQLAHTHASVTGTSIDDVVQDLARATAEWAVNGGG